MLSQLAVVLESVRFCKVESPLSWTRATLGRALVGELPHLERAVVVGEVAGGGAGGGSGG